MRVLVTGIDSFIGSWLCEALVARGDEVVGLTRRPNEAAGSPGVSRQVADVRDALEVQHIFADARPERVFHLAAQSKVKRSFEDPAETIAVNIGGTAHVLEAVRAHAPAASVLSVGSSAEYGDTGRAHAVLSESLPLAPTSPYGMSKAAQGQLARIFARAYSLCIVHVRPFAILGPRKHGDALSDFASNVALLELGKATQFSVGDTSGVRDFVDVRDFVQALLLLSERGAAGETYNVCHGDVTPLERLIELLRGQSRVAFEPTRDPARMRLADDLRLIGDGSKLRALGYAPKHSLQETVEATLAYWRGVHGPG